VHGRVSAAVRVCKPARARLLSLASPINDVLCTCKEGDRDRAKTTCPHSSLFFRHTRPGAALGLQTLATTFKPALMRPSWTAPPEEPASPTPSPAAAAAPATNAACTPRSALSPVASLFSALRLGGRRRGEGGLVSSASLPRPAGGWVDGGKRWQREGGGAWGRGTAAMAAAAGRRFWDAPPGGGMVR